MLFSVGNVFGNNSELSETSYCLANLFYRWRKTQAFTHQQDLKEKYAIEGFFGSGGGVIGIKSLDT